MNIHELIAAMKSDRPQLEMIVESIELLANQSPHEVSPVEPQVRSVDLVALTTVQSEIEALKSTIKSMEKRFAAQSKLEALELKIDSMANRLEEAEELLNNRLAALEDKQADFRLAEESSSQAKPPQKKKKK